MQDPEKEEAKKETAKREKDKKEKTEKEEAEKEKVEKEEEKDRRKEGPKKGVWKDVRPDLQMREAVTEWLQKMHDWACCNFEVRDRERAIDDYAMKTYGLTVSTVIRVTHQELSGTVYIMESTCHGIAYKSSWLSMTTIW